MANFGNEEVELPRNIVISSLGAAPTAVVEAPGEENEPVYGPVERANIQGNIIPGFNKDHQHFLFFRIGRVRSCKAWLRGIAPLISSLDDVLPFVRAHRALRLRLGVREPTLSSCWINIAFSHRAIARLVNKSDATMFGDASFRQGLAERSTYLGDPVDPKHSGHRRNWRVGGPNKEADILVIVAADEADHLEPVVQSFLAGAESAGLSLLFEQRGDTLPGELRGHEHFGFRDGLSQPAVRGKVSSAPGDFISPRDIDPTDPRATYFARPGQLLVWPGEFLLGEKRQDPEHISASTDAAEPPTYPHWARLGSYLVCRRLVQDVPAFWKFAICAATEVGVSAEQFASMLVGRWPSGAPLMRAPTADDPALAADRWANNHFIFDDDTRDSNLRPIPGYGGDTFSQAKADVLGQVCPHFAHIRKINPRDAATDLGKPSDSLLRMILRRGIPFGRPLVGAKKISPKLINEERGLMFLCYGATIEDQFEFISRRWANSPIQPNSGGHDPIIEQSGANAGRGRFIDFPIGGKTRRIQLTSEWVIPSGGGYFFAPPIDAIANVLGA